MMLNSQRKKRLFNRKKREKLDFIVIGAQKAGTTALDHYLRKHSEVEMAKTKELHFFDTENTFFSKRKTDYSIYEDQFSHSKDKQIKGETTPIYIYWQPSCKRIWEYNKYIKLIAILRNPTERAFSHWNMEFDKQDETKDFSYCIRHEATRLKEALPLQHRVYSYIDRGFYSEQIRRYKRYFNDDQLLFVKYDDFRNNQNSELNKIFDFLNVRKWLTEYKPEVIHKRPSSQTNEGIRKRITEKYLSK